MPPQAPSPGTAGVLGQAMEAGAWAERQWCLEGGGRGGQAAGEANGQVEPWDST